MSAAAYLSGSIRGERQALRCGFDGCRERWRVGAGGTSRSHLAAEGRPRLEMGLGMTFRVLGPHERMRFAPEAWGHLISLSGAGMLNSAELEHLIDRALAQIEGRIALDDLRALIEGGGIADDGLSGDNVTVH